MTHFIDKTISPHDLFPPKPALAERYCLGFMFDPAYERVLLMVKKRPAWQEGLLNGIGGKIESGESCLEAMNREFFEETGLDLPGNFGPNSVHHFEWQHVGTHFRSALYDNQVGSFEVKIFAGTLCLNAMKKARSITDEVVIAVPLNFTVLQKRGVPDLVSHVSLAKDALKKGCTFKIIHPVGMA